jgi:hypothetical protein
MMTFTLLSVYIFAVIYDYILNRIYLQKNFESRKIFYNMLRLQKVEGLKLKDYEPILFANQFLQKNKIIHIGAQPNSKVFYCNEGYGLVKYKSDRFGFRNKDLIWEQVNNKKKTKLLFIGDSFIHGACVHEEDVISSLVQASRNDFISFNLGMGGNNSIMNAYTIKLFLNQIKPEYLIIGIYPNDRFRSPEDKYYAKQINNSNLIENYFDKKKSTLTLSQEVLINIKHRKTNLTEQIQNTFSLKKTIIERAAPYLKLSNTRKQFLFLKEKYLFQLDGDSKILINLANKECKIHKCKIIYMYFPASEYWQNDKNQFAFKNSLKKYIEKYNHTFIDFSEIIKFNDKNFYSIKGGHYSPDTYKIISNELLKHLN